MPVTLEQAAQNATSAYSAAVIDEFRTNPLLDQIVFDDVVNPAGGGATLSYTYRRLVTAPSAQFRALNTEYAPVEVTTEQKSTSLAVLGGAYQIDRILAGVGPAATGEVALQSSQKIKAAQALFGDAVINGDSAASTGTYKDSFDGLKKSLTGTSTEDTTVRNWSGAMDQAKAFQILTDVDDLLSLLDGQAGVIMSNRKAINMIKAASRFANQYVEQVGPRNTALATYAGAVLLDAGFKAGSADPVIPEASKQVALYAVRMGLDGFHGVSTVGSSVIKAYAPDFNAPGAVKTGEVEMGPVGVALKATKAAAVFTKVQVTA